MSIISRKKRIRAKISGTVTRPRISIYRSNKFLYLQAIDDVKGKTMAAADSRQKDFVNIFCKKLSDNKINSIVFDRSGYQYHGQVKNIAEQLRKNGLEF